MTSKKKYEKRLEIKKLNWSSILVSSEIEKRKRRTTNKVKGEIILKCNCLSFMAVYNNLRQTRLCLMSRQD